MLGRRYHILVRGKHDRSRRILPLPAQHKRIAPDFYALACFKYRRIVFFQFGMKTIEHVALHIVLLRIFVDRQRYGRAANKRSKAFGGGNCRSRLRLCPGRLCRPYCGRFCRFCRSGFFFGGIFFVHNYTIFLLYKTRAPASVTKTDTGIKAPETVCAV